MSSDKRPDAEIILHGVKCPKNYAMVKLQLEDMSAGQILSIELDDGVPARNVHKSLMLDDVDILSREQLGESVRLTIMKK
jgi:TusA-related sulfurtransferase